MKIFKFWNTFSALTLSTLIAVAPLNASSALQPNTATTSEVGFKGIENALSWDEVVEYARDTLPQYGILKIKKNGFVYLDVPDEYIHNLFPLLGLEKKGYKEPPYFRSAEATGAHISVFYEDEDVRPNEVGEAFSFELRKIILVYPSKGTTYAVLQVDSPELEALRESYGLRPKLHGHEYHISLAKKVEKVKRQVLGESCQ